MSISSIIMKIANVSFAIFSLIGFSACTGNKSNDTGYLKISGERFHTYYHITYQGTEDFSNGIDSVFEVFNHSANPFDTTSLIAAINNNQGNRMDDILKTIITRSFDISKASGGAYDITCSPLINAWGFGYEHLKEVDAQVIDSLKKFVGYEKITLTNDTLIKQDERMKLDLSSISKGYCSDLIASFLKSRGVENFLVEIGGEIAYKGVNPNGEAWRVGINKPLFDTTGLIQDLEEIIVLQGNGGLATSGNYRNFKLIDGKRVGHTIDPKSGYPIQTDVLSATVIAADCMTADGLATALMVVGSQKAEELMSKFSNTEYLLILGTKDENGFKTMASSGFRQKIISK